MHVMLTAPMTWRQTGEQVTNARLPRKTKVDRQTKLLPPSKAKAETASGKERVKKAAPSSHV